MNQQSVSIPPPSYQEAAGQAARRSSQGPISTTGFTASPSVTARNTGTKVEKCSTRSFIEYRSKKLKKRVKRVLKKTWNAVLPPSGPGVSRTETVLEVMLMGITITIVVLIFASIVVMIII